MDIKKLINRIIHPNNHDSNALIAYLKSKHIDIGVGCKFFSPADTTIDIQRPHLLHIGNYVKVTKGVTILCHDFSRSVLCSVDGYENCGECDETWIGDNVFVGVNTTILMGARIGNNCIVGANSVVSGKFDDGLIIAGNPARPISTIDRYYKKMKEKQINNAVLFVKKWKDKYKRNPTLEEMTDAFAWLYLPHQEETIKNYPQFFNLSGVDKEVYIKNFLESKPDFESFSAFLEYCDRVLDEI